MASTRLAILSIVAPDTLTANGTDTSSSRRATRRDNEAVAASADRAITGSGSNPATAADFSGDALPSGTVSSAAGQTVPVAANTVTQSGQDLTVTLASPSDGAILATASAFATILPVPLATVSITALNASQPDGTASDTPFTFSVTRSGNTAIAASATWSVAGSGSNPATAADFSGDALPSGTVSFAAGQTTQTVTIAVAANTVTQSSQGFTVTLANPSGGATIGTASAAVTILPVPLATVSIAALNASQPDGTASDTPFTFSVTRSGNTAIAASATWSVAGSGSNPATAADFSGDALPSGTISFAAGQTTQTVTIAVAANTVTQSSQGFTVTLANPSGGATIGTASAAATILPVPVLTAPAVPQPSAAGQVVGLILQNPTATPLAAREITFGQAFSDGQVPASQGLVAIINGQPVAVQIDVKSTYADGSVRMGILTLQQPGLAANGSADVMLALAAPSDGAAVDISQFTDANDTITVDLTLHNADGSTTPFHFDVAALLAAALTAGTVSIWLSGPQVTQVRFTAPVTAAMQLTFDVSLYADGTTCTDVAFNNDLAMTPSGGTLTYDVAIAQNGQTVLQKSAITQYQYTTWDQQIWSNGAPQVNVQQDPAALERTGLVQNYDTSVGVLASAIAAETAQMGGSTYGILGSASVTQYMPTTGGRADIGPMPTWNVDWLLTGSSAAARFALAQADAAGSVPWHFLDPTTGDFLMVTDDPTLWSDPRGGRGGTTGLTQQVPGYAETGWAPDAGHQPDLAYYAYLATGDRYDLDQLNAQASWDELTDWPVPRQDGNGLIANGSDQVRQQAWSLRELVEAATVNPDGSAEKAYFTQMLTNNIQYLLNETSTVREGDVSGWFTGAYGNAGMIAPWQQDYLVTSIGLAAGLGIAGAGQLLAWAANFTAGRFLNGADGFNPFDGADYNLSTFDAGTGTAYTTWAQVTQATAAGGQVLATASAWSTSDTPTYINLARAALAEEITYTGSTAAIQAFGWLAANQQGNADAAEFEANPTFDIVPRLADGNLLTLNNTFIRDDTATTTVTAPGGNADQLIYEQGAGNVTITGGNGINILFGGAGNDTLIGGDGGNDLFAGTGTTTLIGGDGNNVMQSGCPTATVAGATTFVLTPADVAHDTIDGFRIGTDHLQITGDAPGSAGLAQVIAGATVDANGNAVLHLTASHDVTLQGIGTSSLGVALFA